MSRDKKSFLFLQNHFLTQGFGLSMHKIYLKKKKKKHKNKKTEPGKDINGNTFPSSGIRAVKEDTTDIANPSSQPKNKCVCRCLGLQWTFGSGLPYLFHSQPHTYPDRSNQMVSLLLYSEYIHTNGQIRCSTIHPRKLQGRENAETSLPLSKSSLRTMVIMVLQKEMDDWKAVSSN